MQNNFKLNYLLYLLFAIVGICWNLTPLCRFPKIFFLPRPGGMIPIHLNKSLVSAENQCGPARKSTYCMILTLMRRLQSNTFFSLRCHFFDLSDIDISDCGSCARLVHCSLLSGCLWNERSVQSAQCCWTRWSSSYPPCVCPCSMIVLQFTAVPRLLSFTQLGHLSDQVADMFSFLFLHVSPFLAHCF